jgi:hypothetical protein
MLLARTLGLSIGLCLTIGVQAQASKGGEQTPAPQKKRQATSRPQAAKPSGPFDSLTEFSATMVGSLMGNAGETRIYRSGKLMRVDSWNKMNFSVTNLDTKETYFVLRRPKLNEERCMREHAPLLQAFPFTFFRPDHKFQRTPSGEDEVDGHHCHVESVVRTTPSGSEMHVKFWEADDLNGFPVKIEVENAGKVNTITYRDVKIGPPDPALFKLPKHCAKGPGH